MRSRGRQVGHRLLCAIRIKRHRCISFGCICANTRFGCRHQLLRLPHQVRPLGVLLLALPFIRPPCLLTVLLHSRVFCPRPRRCQLRRGSELRFVFGRHCRSAGRCRAEAKGTSLLDHTKLELDEAVQRPTERRKIRGCGRLQAAVRHVCGRGRSRRERGTVEAGDAVLWRACPGVQAAPALADDGGTVG